MEANFSDVQFAEEIYSLVVRRIIDFGVSPIIQLNSGS